MSLYMFGSGTVIGRRTDVTPVAPMFLGVLQDIEITFDQTLKELVGQQKLPVDIAPAQMKITGTAKFARLQASSLANMLYGDTVSPGSGIDMATNEAHSVPTATPWAVTVSNSATFLEDFGVFYTSGANAGKELTPVTGTVSTGQYAETAGVYTFSTGDSGLGIGIYYSYTVVTLNQITGINHNMGFGPTFELFANETYTNNAGTVGKLNIKLNACRASKLQFPFKNVDYTIQNLDFQAFADQTGTWGTIASSE